MGPRICCVNGCNSSKSSDKLISFHEFPSNSFMTKIWVNNLRKLNNQEVKNEDVKRLKKICSKHFDPTCVLVTGSGRRSLIADAVPTKFPNGIKSNSKIALHRRVPLDKEITSIPPKTTGCCISGCTTSPETPEQTLYSFPECPSKANTWLRYIRVQNGIAFQMDPGMAVCSKHFRPEHFETNTKALTSIAVPQLFPLRVQPIPCASRPPGSIEAIWLKEDNPDEQTVEIPEEDNKDNILSLFDTEENIDEWEAEPLPEYIHSVDGSAQPVLPSEANMTKNVDIMDLISQTISVDVKNMPSEFGQLELLDHPIIPFASTPGCVQESATPSNTNTNPTKPLIINNSTVPIDQASNKFSVRYPGDLAALTFEKFQALPLEHKWQGLQSLLSKHKKMQTNIKNNQQKLRRSQVKMKKLEKKILENSNPKPILVEHKNTEPAHRLGNLELMAVRTNKCNGFLQAEEVCRFCFEVTDSMLVLNREDDINEWFKQLTGEELFYGPGITMKCCTPCHKAIGNHATDTFGLRDVNQKWKARSEIHQQYISTGQDMKTLCYECGKVCHDVNAVYKHRRRVHPPPKPASCPTCNKEFLNQTRLNQHMVRHKEKQFVCDMCGYAAYMRKDLQRHMIYHHNIGARPSQQPMRAQFYCTLCKYYSGNEAKVKVHLDTHGPDSIAKIVKLRHGRVLGKWKDGDFNSGIRKEEPKAASISSDPTESMDDVEMPSVGNELEKAFVNHDKFLDDWMIEMNNETEDL